MSCWQTVQDYGLRSLGIGERVLPRGDEIGLCEQIVLIGSGLIWNIYFGVLALFLGFFFALALAVAKNSPRASLRKPAEWFIFLFRGSPLFIQFFLFYFLFVSLKNADGSAWAGLFGLDPEANGIRHFFETTLHPIFDPFTAAGLGALVVLFLNTSAYAGEIFYGALRSVPRGDLEAADAYGLTGWSRFRRVIFPTTMRLAWPGYTNEAIFLFHATTLVFFSSFPALQQRGDALYYARYFADRTFNPFVPYPIVAVYFVLITLVVITIFGIVNRRLNRHLPSDSVKKIRYRPTLIR